MNREARNDVLQLAATVLVIIGLALVVYEVRENNAIAYQQSVDANWSNWHNVTIAEMQPDFADAFANSMTNPSELTLSEKIILNAWFATVVGAFRQSIDAAELTDSPEDIEEALSALVDSVSYLFGSRFSRDWFAENSYWMREDMIDAIEREIESVPVGSSLEYFDNLGT